MQNAKLNNNLYDERSAGGIVYRQENGRIYWLVIQTQSKDKKMVYKFPKGHLRQGEFLKRAAEREVEEEGKIKARVVTKIGSKNYILAGRFKRITKKVTFFLMKYVEPSRLKHFDGETILGQEWLEFEEAMEKLAYESEKGFLKKAKEKLKGYNNYE